MKWFAGSLGSCLVGALATLTLAVLVIAIVSPLFGKEIGSLFGVSKTTITAIDIEQARMTHKIEFAERTYTIHIVGSESSLFGLLKSERLLIASATCVAGLDFDRQPETFQVDTGKVKVLLPRAEVLRCGQIAASYFDGKGIIPASTELTNQLQQRALDEITTMARKSDLVAVAEAQAKLKIELQMRQLGFVGVDVVLTGDVSPAH